MASPKGLKKIDWTTDPRFEAAKMLAAALYGRGVRQKTQLFRTWQTLLPTVTAAVLKGRVSVDFATLDQAARDQFGTSITSNKVLQRGHKTFWGKEFTSVYNDVLKVVTQLS